MSSAWSFRSRVAFALLLAGYAYKLTSNTNLLSTQQENGEIYNDHVADGGPPEIGTPSLLAPATNYLRYHEMDPVLFTDDDKRSLHTTSYSKATVVQRAPEWLPRHSDQRTSEDTLRYDGERDKLCTSTCCATPVAISLAQDEHRIINTLDGLDLADVILQHYVNPDNADFFAPILTPELAPCLQPNAIIHWDNHQTMYYYFFSKLRPLINVPYGLITSESDADTPQVHNEQNIQTDDLMIKWFGQSVDITHVTFNDKTINKFPEVFKVNETKALAMEKQRVLEKLVPFPLGLSKHKQHAGMVGLLDKYLKMRNYTNPFKGPEQKKRWTEWAKELSQSEKSNLTAYSDFHDALFVKYSIHTGAPAKVPSNIYRGQLWDLLCNMTNMGTSSSVDHRYIPRDNVSCQTNKISPHETYNVTSTYLFSLSPPGIGWDCYRTYELLLLGVIPIVFGREGNGLDGTYGLFKGLPVLVIPPIAEGGLDPMKASEGEWLEMMRGYVTSQAFLGTDFEVGWEKLFLKYWRRKILKDMGREKDIVRDGEGREYYRTWQYGPNPGKKILCSKHENCLTSEQENDPNY